jgi:hypothetical protein
VLSYERGDVIGTLVPDAVVHEPPGGIFSLAPKVLEPLIGE